jgi:hypothetical protein
VKDLVAGSGTAFDERGEHELKGRPARGACTWFDGGTDRRLVGPSR